MWWWSDRAPVELQSSAAVSDEALKVRVLLVDGGVGARASGWSPREDARCCKRLLRRIWRM